MGLGYGGAVNVARVSGRTCKYWDDVLPVLRASSWNFGNVSSWQLEGNFCRNPDSDVRGPWCITNIETMQMEYCDIDPCSKIFQSIYFVVARAYRNNIFNIRLVIAV